MAGSTPIYGFPYPQPSDLVANYPALGQQLAEDVEDAIAASGKILQVVRATDTTQRMTTSTSFVDVTGMSVTITPQRSTSTVLVLAIFNGSTERTSAQSSAGDFQITDASNVALSGAERMRIAVVNTGTTSTQANVGSMSLIGYASPGSTSAVTYKLRFNAVSGSSTVTCENDDNTGQMYAIEVGA